jgi:hypothetical protein
MTRMLLPVLLSACGVFELRVAVEVPERTLAAWDPSYPLAVTTSRRGELLVRSVVCVPDGDLEVSHVWRQRGGCAVPDALLVRVEEAELADELGCDLNSSVATVTPLEPPLELYWERGPTDDCFGDGDVLAAEITVSP